MKFTEAGMNLIKEFEGCSLVSYQDQGGVWTIGYGSTDNVGPNQTCTQEQALERLLAKTDTLSERIRGIVPDSTRDNEFSALVCFAYNVGCGALAKSTLLFKFKQGEKLGAADEFLRWDKVNGLDRPGLLRRRQAEREMFLNTTDSGT